MSIYSEVRKNLEELYSQIKPDNFDVWYNDLKNVIDLLMSDSYPEYFLRILDSIRESYRIELKKAQEDKRQEIEIKLRKLSYLLNSLKQKKPDYLIERLRLKGNDFARDSNLRKVFSDQIFRILEQARLGKRDTVLYMIVRTLATFNKEVPEELIEAIKHHYDLSLFRSFIYSFLSAFSKMEENESLKEEENNG
jgi:hypothetical protein